MAVPFLWYFELHYTNSQDLLHKVSGETVCEKANAAYKRTKKWCSQNNNKLVYFDATTTVAHHKANERLCTLRL
jgi:hypothetical protein